jgi:hypothetical protein
MSCFVQIKFTAEESFTKYTNITTKLNWKLFTKVNGTKQGSLGLDRQMNVEKRTRFNLERFTENLIKRGKCQML